jgi:hypothetical protein
VKQASAVFRIALLCVCLVFVGCGPKAEDSTNDGSAAAPANQGGQGSTATGAGPVIDFRSEPDPPKTGDNTVEVSVKQPDGAPLGDATVTVAFTMPAMPAMNMPAMRTDATLLPDGDGRYRGKVPLSMAGTWNVAVKVSRGSDELGSKQFSVIAK